MCVETVNQFVKRINANDVQGIVAMMTEDHRFIDSVGTVVAGSDKMAEGWAAYLGMMTDYRIEIRETLCRGSTVVLLGNAQGTLSTDGTCNAESVWQMPAAWRVVIRDGRISEWQVYADNEVVRQLLSAAADQQGARNDPHTRAITTSSSADPEFLTGDAKPSSVSRALLSITAAWIVSLGFDVLLHAGLLARWYVQPSPFLLGPNEAFQRISFGYLAFLVATGVLYWLIRRLNIRSAVAGLRFSAVAGCIVWSVFGLGLYSISTAPFPLLLGWWIGQTIESGLAGAVLGASANGVSLKRIWTLVAAAVFTFLAATVVLQSVGLAPPMKMA